MFKSISALALAGLMLASVTFAHGFDAKVGAEVNGNVRAHVLSKLFDRHDDGDNDQDRFVIVGTVNSVSTNSLSVHSNKTNTDLTVLTDSDTTIKLGGDTVALASLKAGETVVIVGEKENTTFTADHIRLVVKLQKAFGEVTAKTDTSVTIKNNVSGETKTVIVNPDTKVSINGEVKTTADIQVGDSGVVKFKAAVEGFVAKMIRLFR